MQVTKTSLLTGKTHTLELDITQEQFEESQRSIGMRRHMQDIVPHLSPDDREFLMTGTTAEEWNTVFPEDA